MQEIFITVRSFQDVRSLSNLAAKEDFRILLTDGNLTVNATSPMSLFSLNLGKPLKLLLDCSEEDCEAFRRKVGRFTLD